MLRALAAFSLVLLLGSYNAFAQSLTAPSTWKNQRGSEMKISAIDSKGAFTGEYINNAAGFDCRGTPGFELKGSQSGARVRFSVVWKNAQKDCNSITAWRVRIQGNTIRTRWTLAYADQNGGIRILTGRDTFQLAN